MKPLEGLLVLDMTQFMSGPLCTMILSDLGAEVIKFERPPVGDTSRWSPPGREGASSYFVSLNRGKKSVLLDLKNPGQRQAFLEIAKQADVLLENFKPGTMDKYGVGYEALKEINPRLVYTAISGYGQTGPDCKRGALDLVIQAESGLMSITGEKGGQPLKAGTSSSDLAAGLYAAVGTLAALHQAQKTGRGEYVDVAMLDATFATLENAVARYFVSGEVPGPLGNRHPSAAPFQPFNTADGIVMVCTVGDENWQRFALAIGREDLAADARFASMKLRQENVDALDAAVQAELDGWTSQKLMETLDKAGVVNGQLNTLDQAVQNPQLRARNMVVDVAYPGAAPLKAAGSPIKLGGEVGQTEYYCPGLGEDTLAVMTRYAGLGTEEVQALYGEAFAGVEEVVKKRALY